MRKPRAQLLALSATLSIAVFSGCAQDLKAASFPDGSYVGSSSPDEAGAIGTINFTIKSGVITEASFVVKDPDGTPHDESYGLSKATGQPVDEAFYQRAQAAVKAERQYVEQFKEAGDVEQVDLIAGASISHQQFVEAVSDALSRK